MLILLIFEIRVGIKNLIFEINYQIIVDIIYVLLPILW